MDTSTANGKLLLMMLGTVSEIERTNFNTCFKCNTTFEEKKDN
jgi:hypothetical protein